MKRGKPMSITETNEQIADNLKKIHHKIEKALVGGYKKTETGAVNAFNQVSDRFIKSFFIKDGKSVGDAKARLQASAHSSKEKTKKYHMPSLKH